MATLCGMAVPPGRRSRANSLDGEADFYRIAAEVAAGNFIRGTFATATGLRRPARSEDVVRRRATTLGLPQGLDQPVQLRQPSSADLNTPRIDSYRFSMANLEDSQDVDLDAILGELCALESQCDEAIAEGSGLGLGPAGKRTSAPVHGAPGLGSGGQTGLGLGMALNSHSRSNSDGHRDFMCKTSSVRTDSPDNDSAFSDNVSMLSSESSASSGGSGGSSGQNNACLAPSPTQMDAAKAEKIRIALEKMREAAVQKLFIKVFTSDGSAKSLLVDEKMTVGHVTRLLADKNHVNLEPKWAVLEHLPDLHMERVYEDHELLVDNLMMWTRDSKNKLLFLERAEERTRLFLQPEAFLLGKQECADFDDHARALLLEEFFSSPGVGVPEVEGPLYIKSDSKKGWKKHQCVLRASGLYYHPKEKAKVSSRDLVCLATFDVNQVYYGVGWKKKHKAPTEFCFAIKHPKLQQPKSAKHIKFLCADDADTLHRWVVGIRVAKYGRQLQENYRSLSEELAQEELDRLAKARSCSVASIHASSMSPASMLSPAGLGLSRLGSIVPSSGASSSSSSGCLSDAGRSSSTEQDNDLDVRSMGGFECEFPSGTIKRKPSAIPSLPLTSTTRQIIENGEDENDKAGGGTLTRRLSRRRSTMADADGASIGSSGSNSSTLKRHTTYSACRGSPSHASPVASPSHLSPLDAATPVAMSPASATPTASPVPSIGAVPHSPVLYASVAYASLPVVPQGVNGHGLGHGDEVDGAGSDLESLPLPPPPELSQSTLSLDSLPPPPAPGELYNGELSGSSLSLASLPPPPPSPPPPAPAKKISFKLPPRSCSPEEVQYDQPRVQYGSMQYDSMPSMPPEMPELPPHPILQAKSVLRNGTANATNGHGPAYAHTGSMPHQNGHKKISFNLGEDGIVNGGRDDRKTASLGHQKRITFKLPSPSDERPPMRVPPVPAFAGEAPPLLARKPLPPRRSENTRLSSGPLPEPEPDFLKDLQRVMQRKWQVAQKCKQEPTTTPHEVLGFRDPPPPVADYKETNVSNWVQEHYGTSEDELDNLYENVLNRIPELSCDTRTVAQYAMPAPVPNQQSAIALAAAKKRPPPPPPKRSETTHLTTYSSPQRMH
ncbi:LOW QUALITY PROTEIN: amyloid beta A4 precursor protein-binding family B member 1-interacting protein-like [Thrips palmi]|uniref:LOW QUALITY PROTEIN: amyloid beta A4 precursor protein-binding family B member 1-interacting protein-like n=1 Tax=Thrips palmi TaxID=161013 RepID=A0A6P9AC67_THRPL|nr:LOW QUALITY PROTEIN: amyloid beta A4 precursor protein-binding family B member 1-interacting protein-like [Thrips palmi]